MKFSKFIHLLKIVDKDKSWDRHKLIEIPELKWDSNEINPKLGTEALKYFQKSVDKI